MEARQRAEQHPTPPLRASRLVMRPVQLRGRPSASLSLQRIHAQCLRDAERSWDHELGPGKGMWHWKAPASTQAELAFVYQTVAHEHEYNARAVGIRPRVNICVCWNGRDVIRRSSKHLMAYMT